MNKNDRFYYSIDSRGIDFNIDLPGTKKGYLKIESREELEEIINLCEGTKGTLSYVVPIKKIKKMILPVGEKYPVGEKTGEIKEGKRFEGELNGQKGTFIEWTADEWIFWKWRGSITPDIGDEDTYNTAPHFVRAITPSDECVERIKKKYGLETHVLPETKTIVTVSSTTSTTIPNDLTTPTTIPEGKSWLFGLIQQSNSQK